MTIRSQALSRSCIRLLLLFAVAAAFHSAPAHADWTGEWLLGVAWNADTELWIRQDNQPDLRFEAEFSTKPFEQPIYWALRVGWQGERHGWALDLLHHKLILENTTPEVESFSITHGYNLLTAQHIWLRSRWRWTAMLGVVVAHPESTVRGLKKDESTGWHDAGYEVAGPVVAGGVATSFRLGSIFEIAVEARATWSQVSVDVAEGRANLDNFALHLLLGPRLRIP
jgi:hypothetical protein